MPDIDQIVRKGQEQLRVLMGGKGGPPGRRDGPGGIGRGGWFLIAGLVLVGWAYLSLYRVETGEQAAELLFGQYIGTEGEGLNFAPWPVVTYEKRAVRRERQIAVGINNRGRGTERDEGLMLTGDENIVDIDFQVVWNISNLSDFLFNLKDHESTIKAVSESAMREIVARSNLQAIITENRGAIGSELESLVQSTLDSYEAGINIVRVNFNRADPPEPVQDAFRDVQAAEQDRDRFEKEAESYANERTANARGLAEEIKQDAEAYRARVVNEAEGEASRFRAIYDEYALAPEVTRKRMYLETMERVLGDVEKIIIDQTASDAQGVVPYLPLPELRRTTEAN
ncbi:MAG: FtsH protease activity modulator HflK [Pseudomonadota bacterium]